MNQCPDLPICVHRLLPLAVVTCLLSAGTAAAQLVLGDPPPPEPEAKQRLDLEALITSQRVEEQSINDAVWTLEPTPGRVIVQVPIEIEPIGEESTLGQPAVSLRGGRFICWRIVPDEEQAGQRRDFGGPRRGFDGPPPGFGGPDDMMFPGGRFDQPPGDPGQPGFEQQDEAAIPEGAPLVSRRITVTPDGRLAWSVDRALPSAEVSQGDNLYVYYVRADLLKEKEPERPERQTRGENENIVEFQRKQREATARYREEALEFRRLREAVRDVRTEFEIDMPPRVWAVFEVSETLREVSFNGPDPLPWEVKTHEFYALRELASQNVGGNELTYQDYQQLLTVKEVSQDEHPLSRRATVIALRDAGMLGKSKPRDPLHTLLGGIIAADDAQARQMLLQTLVSMPPNESTLMLLREASDFLTPEMKLTTLRTALMGDASDQQQRRRMIDTANQAMMDPTGPDPGEVMVALAQSLERRGGYNRGDVPGADPVQRINIEALPHDRRDAAIAGVIRAAGESDFALRVLETKLLGSSDAALTARTLELLATASPGGNLIAPLADALMSFAFGPAAQDAAAVPDTTLVQRLPLNSPSHVMFRLLNAGDPALREQAWRALPAFAAGQDSRRRGYRSPPRGHGEEDADVVDMILLAGLGRPQTPPQLVSFFKNLPDPRRAAEGLVEVVIGGDDDASRLAIDNLLGSRYPLREALEQLPPEDRTAFAGRVYTLKRGQRPLIVGLLSDEDASRRLLAWFAGELMENRVPGTAAWAEQTGGEQQLLRLAASSDEDVAAGAVAALVASVGGDETAARETAAIWAEADNRTVTGLSELWTRARRDIFTRRIEQAQGSYRLVLLLPEERPEGADPATQQPQGMPPDMPPDMPPGMPPEMMDPSMYGEFGPGGPMGPMDPAATEVDPPRKVVLGVVDLLVDAGQPMISNGIVTVNIPDEAMVLRVPRLSEVKALGVEEIEDVKLELVTRPVDLLPQDDGSWRGGFMLPAQGAGALVLEPMEGP